MSIFIFIRDEFLLNLAFENMLKYLFVVFFHVDVNEFCSCWLFSSILVEKPTETQLFFFQKKNNNKTEKE